MAELNLVAAASNTILRLLAIESRMISAIFVIAAFLCLLLWIDRGLVLPWFWDSAEMQRQERNFWWLQAYHEERMGKQPTGILRRTTTTTTYSSNSIEKEQNDSTMTTGREHEKIVTLLTTSSEEEKIGWTQEKRIVKHVRFEAPPATAMSAIPAEFGEKETRSPLYDGKPINPSLFGIII